MNNPYEIIKSFYTKDWDNVSDADKARNFFMINRICSINFPLQSQMFNNIKIRPEKVVDFWKSLMTKLYKSPPKWIWTKTIKSEKEKDKNYKEEVINFIKEKNKISDREIKEMIHFFPKKFDSYYKDIENLIS